MSMNAKIVNAFVNANGLSSVNAVAQSLGWGWHRTHRALRELGYV